MNNIQPDYTTNPPLNPADHALLLRDFFTALFRPHETVFIYGLLSDDRIAHYRDHIEEIINLHPSRGTTYWSEKDGRYEPLRYVPLCSRKASSLNTKTIPLLHAFNQKGYSIFFCVHPLSCNDRMQATVRLARHVFVEADDKDHLEEQLEILERYKDRISAITFSGRRSYHAFVRLHDIRNNRLWTFRDVVAFRRAEREKQSFPKPKYDWSDYEYLSDIWEGVFRVKGLKVDSTCIGDSSKLARVPGFLHPETGVACRVDHLNPSAHTQSASLIEERHAVRVSTSEDPIDHDPSEGTELEGKYRIRVLDRQEEPSPDKKTGREEEREKRKTAMTDVASNGAHAVAETYLDLLDVYMAMKEKGIPARHQRIRLHRALFMAARVFNWSEEKIAQEWRHVVSMAPSSTDKTRDEAVKDMLRAYHKGHSYIRPYLPRLDYLPALSDDLLRENLRAWECPYLDKAVKIIQKVLLPLAVKFPRKALHGTLGIHRKEFKRAVRGTAYADVIRWMEDRKLLVITNRHYISGIRTKQFWLNIALLLYVSGFKSEELDWSRHEAFVQEVVMAAA